MYTCTLPNKINGVDISLIGQAIDGRGITECVMESCASNPCANGGTCLEDSTSYTCTCPLQFDGPTCSNAGEFDIR